MRSLLLVVIVSLVAAPAMADVLWDQSAYDPAINALVDQEFGDYPDYSSYMVNDVVTDAGGWEVDSITAYFTNTASAWAPVTTARLNVFAKTDALPTAGDDPVAGIEVGVTLTDTGTYWEIAASGLALSLAGGTEYWIGLTPIGDFGVVGQEFHAGAAPLVGADTAWRNPGDGFALGADWQDTAAVGAGEWPGLYDSAFLMEGTIVPEPSVLTLLGCGALALIRRRR